ncbi:MAG: hypothetical protein R3190_10295, partial [Thermoanaerobaculia bacterium]|nr:hypothetical protein [Thermoanaerobaculia bacterium]
RLLLEGAATPEDWQAIGAAARRRHDPDGEPYTELHHVLALAGAGDVRELDRWLDEWIDDGTCRTAPDGRCRTLLAVAYGLRCFAAGDYLAAARLLAKSAPSVARLGGSRAQNQLFAWIGEEACRRARASDARRPETGASTRPASADAA